MYWTADNTTAPVEVLPYSPSRYVKMLSNGEMQDQSIPTQANISFYPLIIESANANIDVQALSMHSLNAAEIKQSFWRGNYGFARGVNSANPDWDDPTTWNGGNPNNTLPGSGDVQAKSVFVTSTHLHQLFWRNNERYYRKIPISGGNVQWSPPLAFGGPVLASSLPGSGDIQAQADFVLGNNLHQAYWRNNQGYHRKVPIIGGSVKWADASPYNGPIPITGLPGSGNMEAQARCVVGNKFHQTYWCGNKGYTRSVDIISGSINMGTATPWKEILSTELPVGPS